MQGAGATWNEKPVSFPARGPLEAFMSASLLNLEPEVRTLSEEDTRDFSSIAVSEMKVLESDIFGSSLSFPMVNGSEVSLIM